MISTQKAKGFWTSFCRAGLDFVYPGRCSLCRLFAPLNPCVQCLGEMQPTSPVLSYQPNDHLDFQGSVFRYPGRAGQAVRCLKYQRYTGLSEFMAESVSNLVEMEGIEYDFAVPIPIHWRRLASRGFNQAELIASKLPKRSTALRRTRFTQPQAGLTTTQRLKNLEGAFEVIRDVSQQSILLIDDVVTSGQTAMECARVLRVAGAKEVGILAFCGDAY